jgi:hypothetical protein
MSIVASVFNNEKPWPWLVQSKRRSMRFAPQSRREKSVKSEDKSDEAEVKGNFNGFTVKFGLPWPKYDLR